MSIFDNITYGLKLKGIKNKSELEQRVENALKHNSASSDKPLIINITRENNDIVVSNNIQKKNIIEISMKTGLQNLKARVQLIINKELIFKEENNSFVVKIPVIEKSESFNYRG